MGDEERACELDGVEDCELVAVPELVAVGLGDSDCEDVARCVVEGLCVPDGEAACVSVGVEERLTVTNCDGVAVRVSPPDTVCEGDSVADGDTEGDDELEGVELNERVGP